MIQNPSAGSRSEARWLQFGRPTAWRATADMHVCPLFTGVVPHVGGVIAMGSTTVLIGNLPAARQGDMIIESGPPNSISMGEPTVMIG